MLIVIEFEKYRLDFTKKVFFFISFFFLVNLTLKAWN